MNAVITNVLSRDGYKKLEAIEDRKKKTALSADIKRSIVRRILNFI